MIAQVTQEEIERQRYEARLTGIRDDNWRRECALAEVYARLNAKPLALGIAIGRIQFLQQFFLDKVTQTEELLLQSIEELQLLADRLEHSFMDAKTHNASFLRFKERHP